MTPAGPCPDKLSVFFLTDDCFWLLSMPLDALPKGKVSIELSLQDMQTLFRIGVRDGQQFPRGWCNDVDHLSRPERGM